MKLVIQIIITLVAIVSVLWLHSDPGFDSLMASLASLMAVAVIDISKKTLNKNLTHFVRSRPYSIELCLILID